MKLPIIEKQKIKQSSIDYSGLGLRVGLEIHQRLNTTKLFCECASGQREKATYEIERRLRPVAGELGDIDPAALYEFLRNKRFIYKIYPNETCLVELDEEPPHTLNADALNVALQIAKMLRCTIPEELHVMRKTVIDGSNTGGFQRTLIVGINGILETDKGTIGIPTVCLEEESARPEMSSDGKVIYRLNSLGIPLIEISTTSDINNPELAREVAETLGMLLRSTGKVQRGIGSIRQDINISISKGSRVEIKGYQELEQIPKLIENEIKRQIDLIKIKDELVVRRGVLEKHFTSAQDVTGLFEKTKNDMLRKILLDNGRIITIRLPKFAGLLKQECGDRTLGRELSGFAQAYGLGGLIHTDEDLSKYGLFSEFEEIKNKFSMELRQTTAKKEPSEDCYIVLAGKMPQVQKAADAIIERAKLCLRGVPEETRIADGTGSKYSRPLPGRARMYPETDIPPLILSEETINALEIPKSLTEKEKELEKILPKDLARQMTSSRYLEWFDELRKKYDAKLVAATLLMDLKALKRDGHDVSKLGKDDLSILFDLISKEKIPKNKEIINEILIKRIKEVKWEKILQDHQLLNENELRKLIRAAVAENKGKRENVLMGIVMSAVKGRASGEKVIRIIREEMK